MKNHVIQKIKLMVLDIHTICKKTLILILTFIMMICAINACRLYTVANEIDTTNLDGQKFAIINGNRKYAITSQIQEVNSNKYLAGSFFQTSIIKGDDGNYYANSYSDAVKTELEKIKIWTFEVFQKEKSQYYITTMINNTKYYLNINGASVTIVNQPNEQTSVITVSESNVGRYSGQVRLTNQIIESNSSFGMAINLYGDETYFGGYADNGANEYFYLVSDILPMPDTVKDTITPSGTVINLFDYWTSTEDASDYVEGQYENGINDSHALKFVKTSIDEMNEWTGSKNVYPGIVDNTLDNGYPVLAENQVNLIKNSNHSAYQNKNAYTAESLAYLFNPDKVYDTGYRKTYRNVSGLLQLDNLGYYYYDSQKNFAELNKETNVFTLYDKKGVLHGGSAETDGQFFPFNSFKESAFNTSTSSEINHYFGVTLTSRFVQQYDGYTDAKRSSATTFEFSGDDDVWIFIDGVLVADLGGIHDAASVKIDFSTGNITINDGNPTKLYDAFKAAGKQDTVEWSTDVDNDGISDTFANDTYHTLKFFYLERGNTDSNLMLKYNLQNYPASGIYKVNQYGTTLPGATFAIYAADKNYNYLNDLKGNVVTLDNDYSYDNNGNIIDANGNILVNALYYGTTDSTGEMVFVDEDGMPYPLQELESLFGTYFILKEIRAPTGYRILNDNIHMQITNKVLVCNNTFDTGVNTSPSLQMVAPNHLKKVNGDVFDFYNYNGDDFETNGTLFAVVLKYNGEKDETELKKQENWSPVYGTADAGFSVVDVNEFNSESNDFGKKFIAAAIDTAKKYKESQNEFKLSVSGQMEASLNGMPGDIRNYYYMLKKYDKDNLKNTQYTIAYYWSEASSLAGATENNTVRIDADYTDNDKNTTYEISRFFGATIEIPNLYNRMIVQKTDENGDLVNGATFAMYEVSEENDKIYYKASDGTLILLQASENNFNEGDAIDRNGSKGTYVVDSNTGIIKVTFSSTAYIYPVKKGVDENNNTIYQVSQTTSKDENQLGEDGTAVFEAMNAGQYYIREISAPSGYRLNSSEVMVLVTNNSIYANAGSANDGITVGRGPGYVVSTLEEFASQGQIDNTLTWIYSLLKTSDTSTSFKDVNSTNYYKDWKYITKNYADSKESMTADPSYALTSYLKYDKEDENTIFNYTLNDARTSETTKTVSNTRRLYTNIGWSYLEIYQDYDYGSKNHISKANYEDLRTEKDTSGRIVSKDISHLFSRSVYIKITDQPQKLNIKKVDAEDINKTLPNAEFKLQRTVGNITYYAKNNNGNLSWVKTEDEAGTLTTGGDGIITILSGLYDGNYKLTETKAPDNYAITTKDTTFSIENGVISGIDINTVKTIGENDTITDITSVITISNTFIGDFVFTKTNKQKVPLKDAHFALYHLECTDNNHDHKNDEVTIDAEGNLTVKVNDSEKREYINCYEVKKVSSNDKGQVVFKEIELNEKYRLVEYKQPDGYALPEGQWDIEYVPNVDEYTFKITAVGNSPAFAYDKGKYTVINYTTSDLPLTGYYGISLFLMIGALLILIAIALYIRNKIKLYYQRR